MDRLGVEPQTADAELVLFGLCTDTAFFRHLGAMSADVFLTVARLVAKGASPAALYERIYGGRSLEERRKLGVTLSRTESHAGGKVLLCHQSLEERSTGSDELYRLLQTVEGVRVIVLIRQDDDTMFSVSLRSSGGLDVGEVAKRLGGGGHKNAAGCQMSGALASVSRRVLDAVIPMVTSM
jgi:phosphoesterase RecJ-like protein